MESVVSGPSPELRSEIARAGAGAGKTTRLTNKVLALARLFLNKEKRLPNVVVTTFTRKATQELRERLMTKALARKNEDLIDFVSSGGHLQVSTIHGVLSLFLSRYGHMFGVDPDFKVVDDMEATRMARRVLRRTIFADQEFQDLLDDYDFNLLCRLLKSYERAWVENPQIEPFAKEHLQQSMSAMRAKLAAQTTEIAAFIQGNAQNEKWLALGNWLHGLSPKIETSDWTLLVNEVSDHFKGFRKPPASKNSGIDKDSDTQIKDLLDQLKSLDREIYSNEFNDRVLLNHGRFERLAKEFCRDWQTHKAEEGKFEISDLELLSLLAVRKHPEVAQSFANEWDFWLVDEFQDTSPIQVELISALRGGKPEYVVGDPQQSIYLFRGARSQVFAEKEQVMKSGGGKYRMLQKNYRSIPELLLFFNDFFGGLSGHFMPMEEHLHEGQTTDPATEVAKIVPGAEDELPSVVTNILELLESSVRPEQICILARAHKYLQQIAEVLREYNVPTHLHSGASFYDRREVQDALALLKFLVNPHDNFNTVQLLRSPWFMLPDYLLAENAQKAHQSGQSLWFCLNENEDGRVIKELSKLLVRLPGEGVSEAFVQALVHFGYFDFSHYHDVTGRREANLWKLVCQLRTEERKPGFSYLNFVGKNMWDLTESSGAEEADAVPAAEPNRVNLMTIHASKGLQFDYVFLPFLGKAPYQAFVPEFRIDEARGLWAMPIPSARELKNLDCLPARETLDHLHDRELEEQDRLFYVAMTRARQKVFLSWSGPAKPHSLASRIQLDLTTGIRKAESYSYFVDKGPWQPDPRPTEQSIETTLPDKISDSASLGRKSVSVTELLSDEEALGAVSKASIPKRVEAVNLGVKVHRLFEALHYQPDLILDEYINSQFSNDFEKIHQAMAWAMKQTDVPLKDLISDGNVEWGFVVDNFEYDETKYKLEGQIDLWGRDRAGGVWLVDYKSGDTRNSDKALKQLRLYARALLACKAVGSEETIRLCALYPFAEQAIVEAF